MMCNNIDYQTTQQKQTNHNSLYTLADSELQSSFDLEDQNKAVDWNNTNSHKGKLVIAYDSKVGTRPYAQEYSMRCMSNQTMTTLDIWYIDYLQIRY